MPIFITSKSSKGKKVKEPTQAPPKYPNDWTHLRPQTRNGTQRKKLKKSSLSHLYFPSRTHKPNFHSITPFFVVSGHDHPPKRGRFYPNSGEPTTPCLLCNDPDWTLPDSDLQGSHNRAHHHESYSAFTRRGSRQRRSCSGLCDTMRALLLSSALSETTTPFGA